MIFLAVDGNLWYWPDKEAFAPSTLLRLSRKPELRANFFGPRNLKRKYLLCALSDWQSVGWVTVVGEMVEVEYVAHQCFERWNRKHRLPGIGWTIKRGPIHEE